MAPSTGFGLRICQQDKDLGRINIYQEARPDLIYLIMMAGPVRGASSFGPWVAAVAALMAVLLPMQVGAKTAAAALAPAGARRSGFIR